MAAQAWFVDGGAPLGYALTGGLLLGIGALP